MNDADELTPRERIELRAREMMDEATELDEAIRFYLTVQAPSQRRRLLNEELHMHFTRISVALRELLDEAGASIHDGALPSQPPVTENVLLQVTALLGVPGSTAARAERAMRDLVNRSVGTPAIRQRALEWIDAGCRYAAVGRFAPAFQCLLRAKNAWTRPR